MADSRREGDARHLVLRDLIVARGKSAEVAFRRLGQLLSLLRSALPLAVFRPVAGVLLAGAGRRFRQLPVSLVQGLCRDYAARLGFPTPTPDFLSLLRLSPGDSDDELDELDSAWPPSPETADAMRAAVKRAREVGAVSPVQAGVVSLVCGLGDVPGSAVATRVQSVRQAVETCVGFAGCTVVDGMDGYGPITVRCKDDKVPAEAHGVAAATVRFVCGTDETALDVSLSGSSGLTFADFALLAAWVGRRAAESVRCGAGLVSITAELSWLLQGASSVDSSQADGKRGARSSPASVTNRVINGLAVDLDLFAQRRRSAVAGVAPRSLGDVEQRVRSGLVKLFSEYKAKESFKNKQGKTVLARGEVLRIVHLQAVATRRGIRSFNEMATSYERAFTSGDKDPLLPMVAFHGTRSRRNIDSIARSGLVCPGDWTRDGKLVEVSTGALFGEGIYVSRNFQVARWFGHCDSRGAGQVFVGIMLPGSPWFCTTRQRRRGESAAEASVPRVRYGQSCQSGFDSHINRYGAEEGFDVCVLFEPAQFLPLFLLTFAPANTPMAIDRVLNDPTPQADRKIKSKGKSRKTKDEIRAEFGREPGLEARAMPGVPGLWCVPVSAARLESLEKRRAAWRGETLRSSRNLSRQDWSGSVGVAFLVDKSQSMGSSFRRLALPACARIHAALDPDRADAILFGRSVEAYRVPNSSFFSKKGTLATKTKLEPATSLVRGFETAVDIILKRHNASVDAERKRLKDELIQLASAQAALSKAMADSAGARGTGRISPEQAECNRLAEKLSTLTKELAGLREKAALTGWHNKPNQKLRMAVRSKAGQIAAACRLLRRARVRVWRAVDAKSRDATSSDATSSDTQPTKAKTNNTDLQSLDPTALLKIGEKTKKALGKRIRSAEASLEAAAARTGWFDDSEVSRNSTSLHVLVILSDGVETVSSNDATDRALERMHRLVKASGARIMVKVIGLGRQADTSLTMRMKLAIQTVSAWEPAPIHYAPRRKSLPKVVSKLCSELRVASCGFGLEVSTDTDRTLASGLVRSLVDPPYPSCQTRLRADGNPTVLIIRSERCPQTIRMDGSAMPLYPVESDELKRKKRNQAGATGAVRADAARADAAGTDWCEVWLIALRSLVIDLKSQAVAGRRGLRKALALVRKVAHGIKSNAFDSKAFSNMPPPERASRMSRVRGLAAQVGALTNGLEDSVRIQSTMTSHEKAKWLVQVGKMKFGAKALRRAAEVNTPEAASDLVRRADALPLLSKDTVEGPKTTVSGPSTLVASATKCWQEVKDSAMLRRVAEKLKKVDAKEAEVACAARRGTPVDPLPVVSVHSRFDKKHIERERLELMADLTPLDLLCSFGMVGRLVRVRRSEASNINPWTICVEYVSPYTATTHGALCALDAGLPLSDPEQGDTPDVLIVPDPRNPGPFNAFLRSGLYKLYLSMVFTRSVDLALPSQDTALLMSALCTSIEQLSPMPSVPARSRSPSPANKKRRRSRSGSRGRRAAGGSTRRLARPAQSKPVSPGPPEPGSMRWRKIETTLHILLHVCDRVRTSRGYWDGIVRKLRGTNPAASLTEARGDDISSVIKVLAAILSSEDGIQLASSDDNADVCLAILAETASREARVYLKVEAARSAARAAVAIRVSGQGGSGHKATPSGLSPTRLAAHRILVKAMGIVPDSVRAPAPDDEPEPLRVTHSADFDQKKCLRHSQRFFATLRTNCNVRTVAAAFGFARALAGWAADEEGSNNEVSTNPPKGKKRGKVLGRLKRVLTDTPLGGEAEQRLFAAIDDGMRGAKIGRFIRELSTLTESSSEESLNPRMVQSALFCQGVWAHTSSDRKAGGLRPLTKPLPAIQDIARALRKREYEARVAAKMKRIQENQRLKKGQARTLRRLEEQRIFMESHSGVPRTFTPETTAALSQTQDAKSNVVEGAVFIQPSLTKSGLLRHRCSFPKCPLYLKSFATAEDLVNGTRKGLYTHLAPMFGPKWTYVRALHVVGRGCYARHRGNKAAFIKEMVAYYVSQLPKKSKQEEFIAQARKDVADLWDSFTSEGN